MWPAIVHILAASNDTTAAFENTDRGPEAITPGPAHHAAQVKELVFIGREGAEVRLSAGDQDKNWQTINQEMHGFLMENEEGVIKVLQHTGQVLVAIEVFGGMESCLGEADFNSWITIWEPKLRFARGLGIGEEFKSVSGEFQITGVFIW